MEETNWDGYCAGDFKRWYSVLFLVSVEPRTPRPQFVKYRIGQVVRHKRYNYRGVIVGWDSVGKVSETKVTHTHRHTYTKTHTVIFLSKQFENRYSDTWICDVNTLCDHLNMLGSFQFGAWGPFIPYGKSIMMTCIVGAEFCQVKALHFRCLV